MNNTQQFKLIDGTFNAPEAAQILLSLVKSKIDFHNLQKVSNEERFGVDLARSDQRLAELRQLHETLKSICASAGKNGQRVQVDGHIAITLVAALPEPCE